MQFEEMGNMSGKTLMLLPGTCCDYIIKLRHIKGSWHVHEGDANGKKIHPDKRHNKRRT